MAVRILGFGWRAIIFIGVPPVFCLLVLSIWVFTAGWMIYASILAFCSALILFVRPASASRRIFLGLGLFAWAVTILLAGLLDRVPRLYRLFDTEGWFGALIKTAVDTMGSSGFHIFTDIGWRISILGSLAFLLLYASLRSAVAVLTKIDAKFRSRDRGPVPAPASDFWCNLSLAQFVRLFAIAFAFFILVAPPAFAAAETWWGINLHEDADTIAWVGSYILSLEIAGAFAPVPWLAQDVAPKTSEPSGKDVDPDVQGLFEFHCRTDGSHLLLKYKAEEPPILATAKKRVEGLSSRAGKVIEQLSGVHGFDERMIGVVAQHLDGYFGGSGLPLSLVFTDALTEAHYAVFAELYLDCMDHGGVALVICPDALTDDFCKSLDDALDKTGTGLLINRHVVGPGGARRDELYNIIVLPEGFFRAGFLDERDTFAPLLGRLQLLLVLEMQHLDLAWLKLHVRILWDYLDAEDVRLVAQCAELEEPHTVVADKLHGGTGRSVEPLALYRYVPDDHYRLVWSNSDSTNRHLRGRLKFGGNDPIELMGMLASEALVSDNRVVVYDPRKRYYGPGWKRLSDQLQRIRGPVHATRVSSVRAQTRVYGRDTKFVVLVRDEENLTVALHRNYSYRGVGGYLVEIFSNEYPLRNFFKWAIEEWGYGNRNCYDEYMPISPRSKAGVTELVYVLYPRLVSDEGLRQSELEAILGWFPKKRVLDKLGIGVNTEGIRRLFQHEGSGLKINIVRDPHTREAVYTIPPLARNPRIIGFEIPVSIDGTISKRHRLVRSDLGLAYGSGTFIQVDYDYHLVSTVTQDSVVLEPRDPASAGFAARPCYVFAREYSLDLGEKGAIAEDAVEKHGRFSFVRAHLHACFTRKTVGVYELSEGISPFAEKSSPIFTLASADWASANRRYKSVLHLHAWNDLPGATDQLARGKLAFTICVVVHDVITSLFPGQAHRISVISNQTHGLFDGIPATDKLARFLRHRYGSLEQLNGEPCDRWIDIDRIEGSGAGSDNRLDLFIVEDADHDLGVVRALYEVHDRFFGIAKNYTEWVISERTGSDKKPEDSPKLFHRFGADADSELFDWDGALEFISSCI